MSWLKKIKQGLSKTSQGISNFFKKKTKLDPQSLEELEEILIQSDIPPSTVMDIMDGIGKKGFVDGDNAVTLAQEFIAGQISKIMEDSAGSLPLLPLPSGKTKVIMLCGVNGGGKTTTASKLAQKIVNNGHTVMLAACDTFRAAAVEQLEVWAQRVGTPIFKGNDKQEPASVAHQAFVAACEKNIDFLLIDTAGRMHNNDNLMRELEKFVRVLRKIDETAPHDVVMVLDGTNGQNAIVQAEYFSKIVPVTGFIITKLDGSSRGGFLVSIAKKFPGKSIYGIGVGEQVDDLIPFVVSDFSKSLVGIEVE